MNNKKASNAKNKWYFSFELYYVFTHANVIDKDEVHFDMICTDDLEIMSINDISHVIREIQK